MKKQFKHSRIEVIDFKNDVIATSAVTPSTKYEGGGANGSGYITPMPEIDLNSVINFFTE